MTVSGLDKKSIRKFTDREIFIKTFYDALKYQSDKHKIIVFYGVGGIGKTSLRKELSRQIENELKEIIWSTIDLDIPAYRDQETALFILRNTLSQKYKIHFPSFDLAYTLYWQKIHPQTPMTKDNFPLFSGTGVVAGIFRALGEMPYIGVIPKLSKAIKVSGNVFREWWKKRGEEELTMLHTLEAKDILDRMPMFWASDINEFIEKKNRKIVIFLDTFEALWENMRTEGGFFLRDDWIREMISHLPKVLWVICGREKLRWGELEDDWDNYLEQYLIGGFSNEDSHKFLIGCGIEKEEIRNIIISSSRGVPHFMDLAVDTYYEIKNNLRRSPVKTDFAKTQQNVMARFLRYLEQTEIDTLKVISCSRMWNQEIFDLLVKEFRTGYGATPISNLSRFSFITEGTITGTWTMHELMSDSLQAMLEENSFRQIHKFLFGYYNVKLKEVDVKNINDELKKAVNEAYYHGKISLGFEELKAWFNHISRIFERAGIWKTITPLIEDFIILLKGEGSKYLKEISDYNILLSNLYEIQGKIDESLLLLEESLKIRRDLFGEEHHDVSKVINNMAVHYAKQGKYEEAGPLFKKALEISKKILGDNHPEICNAMNNLAIVYSFEKNYEMSESLYKIALSIREENYGKEHPDVAASLNNLAILYEETGRFSDAADLYGKALYVWEKSLGPEHMNTAIAMNNLANVYTKIERYDEAEEFYKKASFIYEKIFGDKCLEYGYSLNNLAAMYNKKGDVKSSLETYISVKEIFTENLGSSGSDTINALKNIAELSYLNKDYSLSEHYYTELLEIYYKSRKTDNQELINATINLADIYLLQGKQKEIKLFKEKTGKNLVKKFGVNHPTTVLLEKHLVKLI
ncbi:MAG: tetratricopeptide repeat protein [Ignavibacteriae bacterium]|nr:tetratricopeptide repeat protein [Ignavibacteriota bacterium]